MSSQPARRRESLTDDGLVFDPRVEGFSQAFERYADLYSPGSDVKATGPDFYARVGAQVLPGMAVFSRTLHAVEHRRERPRIVRDGFDHFTAHVVESGTLLVDADGRAHSLGPGEGVLVDMTRPFRSAPSGRLVTLSIPRERLFENVSDLPSLHGARLAGDDGRLRRLLGGLDAQDAHEATVTALIDAVSARVLPRAPGGRATSGARRERALRIIEADLADPALAPERIAAAAGMSRATLYRAFEPLGGVADWIQTRRLLRVQALLARTSMTISEAGVAAGFLNASHLTFAFQSRFGCNPTAYRRSRTALARGGRSAVEAALHDIGAVLARSGQDPVAA